MHFLEINILTLKILEINNLSYSGKKINLLELGGKVRSFQKKFASLATLQFLDFFQLPSLALYYNYSLATVQFQFFPARFARISF